MVIFNSYVSLPEGIQTPFQGKRHALLDRWAVGSQVLEAFGDHRERTNAEGICRNLTSNGKSFLARHYASRY
jgi:hypothetical protein